MYEERPAAAFALSLVGGVFVLLGAIVLLVVGLFVTGYFPFFFWGGGIVLLALGIVGIVLAILMIMGSIIAYNNPESRVIWGVLILIMSILSWFFAAAGLFIGFLLGLIGGILFLVWRPSIAPGVSVRVCLSCGHQYALSFPTCPYCGTHAPPPTYPPVQPAPAYPPAQPAQPAPPQPVQEQAPPPAQPGTSKVCPNCGQTLDASAKFCSGCGYTVG